MLDAIDKWFLVHPYIGSAIFLVLALFSLICFSETSDGNINDDYSPIGKPSLVGPFLALGFITISVFCFNGWIS